MTDYQLSFANYENTTNIEDQSFLFGMSPDTILTVKNAVRLFLIEFLFETPYYKRNIYRDDFFSFAIIKSRETARSRCMTRGHLTSGLNVVELVSTRQC